MQTRKSGNSSQNSGGSLWQSSTINALSRSQKAQAALASKGSKTEQKKPFVTASQVLQGTLGDQQQQQQFVNSETKQQLKHYHQEIRSPNANFSKNKSPLMTHNFMSPDEPTSNIRSSSKSSKQIGIAQSVPLKGPTNISNQKQKNIMRSGEAKSISGRKKEQQNQWQQEYNQQNKLGNKQIDLEEVAATYEKEKKSISTPITQNQTHTGSGAQQNLFIKNLFFISSNDANAPQAGVLNGRTRNNEGFQREGSLTSKDENSVKLGFSTQLFESAPLSGTNQFQSRQSQFNHSNNTFSSSRHSQPNLIKKGTEFYSINSAGKTTNSRHEGGSQTQKCGSNERNNAIEIAARVLSQLGPLTVSNNQLRIIPNDQVDTLRISAQQSKLLATDPTSSSQKQKKTPKQNAAKSASPVKKFTSSSHIQKISGKNNKTEKKSFHKNDRNIRESLDINESVIIFKDDSSPLQKEEVSPFPLEENQYMGEISLFKGIPQYGTASHIKQTGSYGEMPQGIDKSKKASQHINFHHRENSDKDCQRNQSNKQGMGSTSRNTGEIFNYKMKTLNVAAKREQMTKTVDSNINRCDQNVYSATANKEYAVNVVNDSISESSSYNSKQGKSASKQLLIAKSHSQQQFNLLQKQPSDLQDFSKNDSMQMSINNLFLKPAQLSQAVDSINNETSQFQYNSAQGDKQSEISSTIGVDKQSIRVMARFRPFNDLERELQELNPKNQEMLSFNEDCKTVKLQDEFHTYSSNNTFTFDHIFQPKSSQEEIFDIVGRSMIEDIMKGYNGTIFAYGQTGSGKTFTMYGEDIFDERQMGIVPRACRQIFDHIRNQDLEVEYSIRIQMLEIYKESLRDLLHNSNEKPPELKIKEDPKRGTYVEGLQDVCIVSEEEMMAVICTGETMRHVASTRMNQVSSRSHSICMIDVVQKYPNDSERRGVLNLVDLAGSERVSRSGAQGSALEEAKKINFSLSMLGKVINSLVKNSSHIPYRDSKLTRLLKESLGGNNKTSLIVACSMHYSNYDETLSTLRFAQSAKFIQNKVKLNIKTSNEQLQQMIQQLKAELRAAKEEIFRLRIQLANSSQQNNDSSSLLSSKLDDDLGLRNVDSESSTGIVQQLSKERLVGQTPLGEPPLQAIHNRPHQSLLAKNYEIIETNNNQKTQLLTILSSEFYSPTKNYSTGQPIGGSSALIQSLTNKNEELEMKLISKESDIEALTLIKDELQIKVSSLEEKNNGFKQKMVLLERRIAEYDHDNDFQKGKHIITNHKITSYESEISILKEQVKCLEKALNDSASKNKAMIQDNKETLNVKFTQFLEQQLHLLKVPASEGLEKLMTRAKQVQECDSFITQLELEKDFIQETELFDKAIQSIPLNDRDLLMQNLYTLELFNGVEQGSIPPEITIYLLKNKLIDSSISNHNLQRLLAVNRWRQVVEFGKYKVKSELCENQEKTIDGLEKILEQSRITHDKLKQRVDKLENHINNQRIHQQEGEMGFWTDAASNIESHCDALTNRVGMNIPLDRASNMNKLYHSNSMVSGSVTCSNRNFINSKTRFTKPITSRAVQRMFVKGMDSNTNRFSPGSRASIGRSIQSSSIMTQYYNRQQMKYSAKPQLSQVDSNTGSSSNNTHVSNKNVEACTFEIAAVAAKMESTTINEERKSYDNKQMRTRAISQFAQIYINLEEMKMIESIKQIQELKDYLRLKFSSVGDQPDPISLRVPKLFSQKMKNDAPIKRQHKSSSPPQKGRKRVEVFDKNDREYGRISETSEINRESDGLLVDNQYQPAFTLPEDPDSSAIQEVQMLKNEHICHEGSDCMMTNNSLILGPQGLFGCPPQQNQQQNDLIDRLQEKISHYKLESDQQRIRADEFKKAFQEIKRQNEVLRTQIEEKDVKFNMVLKDEIYQWEEAINQMKTLNEAELQKKQKEINRLHQLLAKWIESYQSLEHKKGIEPKELETLISETMMHKKDISSHQEVLLQGTPKKPSMMNPQPSNFLNPIKKQVEMYSASALKQSLIHSTMKSPLPTTQHFMKTPQSKGQYSKPHMTEIPRRQNAQNNSQYYAQLQLQTQQSCTSPTIVVNLLHSEKRDPIDGNNIMGDTSPAHHNLSSSADSQLSNESIELKVPNQSTSLVEKSPSDNNEQIRIQSRITNNRSQSQWFELATTQKQKYEEDYKASLLLPDQSSESSRIELNLQSPSCLQIDSEFRQSKCSQIGSIMEQKQQHL